MKYCNLFLQYFVLYVMASSFRSLLLLIRVGSSVTIENKLLPGRLWFSSLQGQWLGLFSLRHRIIIGSGAYPAPFSMDTGHKVDHSPPSRAEVKHRIRLHGVVLS